MRDLSIRGGRKSGPIDAPPGSERLTARQIAIAKQRRREGASIGEISNQMGISKETIHRHTRGIKPPTPNDGGAVEETTVRPSVPQNNGGEVPQVQVTKPSVIQIGVELDPELMLMLAGTAHIQGYSSLKTYLKDFALPWLNTLKQTQELLGSSTPEDHLAKMEAVVKGYVEYRQIIAKAQEKVEKHVVKSDGPTGSAS